MLLTHMQHTMAITEKSAALMGTRNIANYRSDEEEPTYTSVYQCEVKYSKSKILFHFK